MILFKIIFLQLCWFLVVWYGKSINPFWQILAALLLVALDYIVYRPKISYRRYLFLMALFLLVGFVNDSSLIWFKIVTPESYQYGNLSLWIIFISYYEQVFLKLQTLPLWIVSLLGGLGGSISYWSALKMGAIVVNPEMGTSFTLSQFVFWAAFFPVSLRLYFQDGLWDSFLVTGATAGIGAVAAGFLSRLGAKVYVTGRNQQKGLAFEEKNHNSKFISLDMANWKEIHEFAKKTEVLDYVVFNAGSMPDNLSVNEYGVEFQCASQLLGHYYLLVWLKKFQKIKPGTRIVWVSSGGMYLKKLDLKSLFQNANYEKVETYANVKRAQVTLVEELSKISEWDDFFIYSMHPGWVATEGLRDALPGFYRFMKNRLRTPEEGSDTILWCLLADNAPESGGFYFDRKKVSPYVSQKYSPAASERAALMSYIEKFKPE